ncbi:methionyl-tRNA formyltransferase [Bythopirellula polymerisocia]|uniref:Methionyl-tRNA formyltransferase n=1 Tax=Bythopirellula polymerisocia TaxID=2528003 RepID=A0A5C6D0H4_9BACT|nr:methionyl-tRNA formyltransferase [Bythopirellula polymerisocia]TWU30370.1 Methionyl-tRNA formyltransferase [Bythopirellula polymerisocia]
MRILMLGTGPFAVPSLRALHASKHEVLLAVSRPPRGRKPLPAPVQLAAESLGIPDWQPETVNSDESRQKFVELQPDLLVVCDYGEILKSETLAVARLGGINLHGSLLPEYRGAAPVQWAVLNGDSETGNTVIRMTPGLDAGPAVGVDRVAIDPDETAGELEFRLAERGADLVMKVVEQLATGTEIVVEQDKSQATKAPRLTKEHGQIDWTRSALEIKNQVRALQPWPRAFTDWQRSSGGPLRLIVHRVALCGDSASNTAPGVVVATGGELVIASGKGNLSLLEIQPTGKRAMRVEEFLRGNSVQVGDRFS